jgi:hypothetical protein
MSIYVEIILGSPLAECAKFGVCQVEELSPDAWQDFQPRHIRHVKAILSLAGASKLRFEFPFDGMMLRTRARFFSPGDFRVEAPKPLPQSLAVAIGLPRESTLMPGLYLPATSATAIIIDMAVKALFAEDVVSGG